MASSTRSKLVDTAMRLFWEKGYGSTSIADVLQVAGVNSGSLYHFFPGKQDLLLAVLARYREGIGEMLLVPAWKNVSDPISRVFALLARYREGIVATDCTYGCPIGSLALEIHEPDPAVRRAIAANFDAWTAAVESCLINASAKLPKAVDRRELAVFVLTTMEGGVMQARAHRDVAYFDASVRQLRAYFDHLREQAARETENPVADKRKRRGAPGKGSRK